MWQNMTLVTLLAMMGVVLLVGVHGDGHAHVHTATSTDDGAGGITTVSQTQSSSSPGGVVAEGGGDAATVAKYLEANPALAAAAAAALGGGGYDYPSAPPATGVPVTQPGLGGLGGLYGLPFGFSKGFNLDVNAGGGLGLGAYYPILEKVIAVVGGGILILLILAFLQGSLSAGGLLHTLGGSFSKAIAGSGTVDIGPIEGSAAGAASFNLNDGLQVRGGRVNDPRFNERVSNSFDRRF